MSRVFAVLLSVGLAAMAAEPVKNFGTVSVGEVIPQVVAGGAWSTDIQLMHAHDEDIPQPFTLQFYGSTGAPMNVPVEGMGMTSVVAGVIPARGSVLIRTGPMFATIAGYAILSTTENRGIVATATLTQKVPDRPDFQASMPSLDDFGDDFQFPFRNDGPYKSTFAFVSGTDQEIIAVARNESGAEMCRKTWEMTDGQHASYVLEDLLPCTLDQRGVVEIVPEFWGSMIAFQFHDSGAFTTQLPFEICCRQNLRPRFP